MRYEPALEHRQRRQPRTTTRRPFSVAATFADRYLHHGELRRFRFYCASMSDTPSNVIYLRPRTPAAKPAPLKIWACGCGSRAFFLYSDGSVQCTDCLEQSLKITCKPARVEPAERR